MKPISHALLAPCAAILFLSAPAPAAQTSADEAEAEETSAVNRIICRREPAPTGSRIGSRRICRTEHQWNAIEAESRNMLEDIGNRSRVGNEGGGGD